MAVMTSQHPEGVAFEQKAQHVPSSDKMALDLDINGTSYRDHTSPQTASPDAPLNPTIELPSSHLSVSDTPAVNGTTNLDATSANTIVDLAQSGFPVASVKNLSLSQLPGSNEVVDAEDTSVLASENIEINASSPNLLSFVDSAVDAALQGAGASSVPPLIEAQESDVRAAEPSGRDALFPASLNEPIPVEAEGLPQKGLTFDSLSAVSSSRPPTVVGPDSTPSQPRTEKTFKPSDTSDTDMIDAPIPSSSKIAREREDDNEYEPLAKRTKTEEEANRAPPSLSSNGALTQNGGSTIASSHPGQILPHQVKEIVKIIRNVLKTTAGKNFRGPVATLWPNFAEAYLERTPNPIDLATIEKKLKGDEYPIMDDFRSDIMLLYTNCLTFNGSDHVVTKSAVEVRDSILSKVASLPAEPPATVPKAAKKQPKRSTPVAEPAPRATPARRPSRSAGTGTTPNAPQTETFALDPSTSTPLIRRDSTKNEGGRPKREIHPPKNKDLIYSVRPKSKKFAIELKFCEEVLNEMKKPKHSAISSPFMVPVDPVALGIPNYFKVIKTPMDISTASQKLQNGHYAKAKDFETDIRQIFANCYKYNPPGNPVREMGKAFEELFDTQWAKKTQWISDHTPAALSPSSTIDSDEEESEEDDEPEQIAPASGTTPAALRLIEEQNKLIALMTAKKPDQALIQMQQDLVQIVQKRVMEETQAQPKKVKKAKPQASKPTKKTPSTKKGAVATSKKSGVNRQKYLGTLEKEVISAGLGSLSDDISDIVLGLIKGDQPGVDVGDDGTLELDIDLVSIPTLWKIYELIMRHAPEVEAMVKKQIQEKDTPRALAKPPPKKKNKPMSKVEQERKIEHLKNSVQEFERHGSGSQEPVIPTVEQQDESSGDDDSSDSEEE